MSCLRIERCYRQPCTLAGFTKHALACLSFMLLCAYVTAEETGGVTKSANTKVLIKTSHGDITAKLYDQRAPITVKNFLDYVDAGHYDGTVFHRVIPRFMIQGGGFLPGMIERETRDPIKNESKNRIRNDRGTLAMARTSDPDSATAQFFINVRMNFSLNYRLGEPGYAVFGEVTKGLDVVDTISIQHTERVMNDVAEYENVPKQDIIIESIHRIQ